MKLKLQFLVVVLALVFTGAFAQDGTLDTSFNNNGYSYADFDNGADTPNMVTLQDDGKIIVAGGAAINTSTSPALVRFLPDGEVDSSFGIGGKVVDTNLGFFKYVGTQSDNKIVTLARINENSTFQMVIVRFLENGERDTTFGEDGYLSLNTASQQVVMEVLNNDNLLVVRKFNNSNTVSLTQYLSNGDLDTTFGDNGTTTSPLENATAFNFKQLKITDTDEVYIMGIRNFSDSFDIVVYKFLPNGYPDDNFAESGIISKLINPIEFYSNIDAAFDVSDRGKIIIAVNYWNCDIGFSLDLLSYLSNGLPETDFGDNGVQIVGYTSLLPRNVIIQGNDKFLLAGTYQDCFEVTFFALKRFFASGDIDTSFGNEGSTSAYYEGVDAILDGQGKIIGIGYSFYFEGDINFVITRHNNTPLGIVDNKIQELMVVPNPSSGIFTLEYDFLNTETPYQISNITGKIIQTGILQSNKTEIDLSSVQSGMYFLKSANTSIKHLKK